MTSNFFADIEGQGYSADLFDINNQYRAAARNEGSTILGGFEGRVGIDQSSAILRARVTHIPNFDRHYALQGNSSQRSIERDQYLRLQEAQEAIYQRHALESDGNYPLHQAVGQGDIEKIQWLVKRGADINAKKDNGTTPLHEASGRGDLGMVRFLVENGANINATKYHDESTPLHWAEYQGHLHIARFLVEKGADINAKKDNGTIPLHEASGRGDLEMVRFLVENGANINASKYHDESTPLHWAAYQGHLKIVRYLVEKGADINAKKDNGATPLRDALARGHFETVQFLKRVCLLRDLRLVFINNFCKNNK